MTLIYPAAEFVRRFGYLSDKAVTILTEKELEIFFADDPEILAILKEVHAKEQVEYAPSLSDKPVEKQILKTEIPQEKPVENEIETELAEPDELGLLSTEKYEKPPETAVNADEKTKQPLLKRIVGNVLYFSMIITVLTSIMAYKQNNNADFSIFGYHIYNVLTDSMRSTIPPGSFVIVKEIDTSKIKVGDDITFYVSSRKSVTHRVIDVVENVENSGVTAFKTKGTDNEYPDQELVFAPNVVGVVTLSIPKLGFAMKFVGDNVFLVGGLFAGLILFLWILNKFIENCTRDRPKKRCKTHPQTSLKRGRY